MLCCYVVVLLLCCVYILLSRYGLFCCCVIVLLCWSIMFSPLYCHNTVLLLCCLYVCFVIALFFWQVHETTKMTKRITCRIIVSLGDGLSRYLTISSYKLDHGVCPSFSFLCLYLVSLQLFFFFDKLLDQTLKAPLCTFPLPLSCIRTCPYLLFFGECGHLIVESKFMLVNVIERAD